MTELRGIGKRMPKTLWCYTFASLALIGIPPASGFVSKWYLAQGALNADVGAFGWIGPVVLLLSALLTAGYLLPVTMNGFFPGKDSGQDAGKEPSMLMLAPLGILAFLAIILGVLPNPLINYMSQLASGLM